MGIFFPAQRAFFLLFKLTNNLIIKYLCFQLTDMKVFHYAYEQKLIFF